MPSVQPQPQRILIIRPSALGDVCRSVPALVSLRRAYPRARIEWLVQDSCAAAVAHHPDLNGVVEFPRAALGSALRSGRVVEVGGYLNDLRRREYDLVYDFQGLARSGLLAWATRASRRVGYADAREGGWIGLTERLRVNPGRHAVDRMLDLLRFSGVEPVPDLRLHTSETERLKVLADPDIPSQRYALLAPTSRWRGKQWPDERFAAIARHCLKHDLKVVMVGSRSERDQIPRCLDLVLQEKNVVDRVGATSVGELMALVQMSRLVIGNDSAAVHMAVGFEKPLVALYGPTRVNLVGPYKREADVIQHVMAGDAMNHKHETESRRIMERISVDEVKLRVDTIMLE